MYLFLNINQIILGSNTWCKIIIILGCLHFYKMGTFYFRSLRILISIFTKQKNFVTKDAHVIRKPILHQLKKYNFPDTKMSIHAFTTIYKNRIKTFMKFSFFWKKCGGMMSPSLDTVKTQALSGNLIPAQWKLPWGYGRANGCILMVNIFLSWKTGDCRPFRL